MSTAGQGYRYRLAILLPAIQLTYVMLIWPLLYARYYVPSDMTGGPPAPPTTAMLNRFFFPVLAVLAVILLVAQRQRPHRFHLFGLGLVACFFAYLALTSAWAIVPLTSLFKLSLFVVQLACLTVSVLVARDVDDLLRPMFWVAIAAVVVNVASVPFVKAAAIGFPGIYSHKNTLGANAAIAGLFCLYAVTRADHRLRVAGTLGAPLVVFLLVISQSKTSLGLMIIAPVIALGLVGLWRVLRLSSAVVMTLLAPPVAFLLAGGLPGFDYRVLSRIVSGDGTFTGRTVLWNYTLARIAEKPVTGWGFQSFWGIGPASPAAKMKDTFIGETPHAHNGYLDMLLQGGVIALVLFILILLMIARWIDKLSDRDVKLGVFVMALFQYMIWKNFLETEWFNGQVTANLLFLLMMLLAMTTPSGRPRT